MAQLDGGQTFKEVMEHRPKNVCDSQSVGKVVLLLNRGRNVNVKPVDNCFVANPGYYICILK